MRGRGGRALRLGALVACLAPGPAPAEVEAPERVALVVSGGVSQGAYQAGATYATLRYLLLLREPAPRNALLQSLAHALADTPDACVPEPGPVQLEVATGASAGNINAWLAGMTWCEADLAEVTPRSNLFYDTWINVGWEKLSPARRDADDYAATFADEIGSDTIRAIGRRLAASPPAKWQEGPYSEHDGLVTRSGFESVEANLVERLAMPRYRPGCRVHTGVTVTRAVPARIPLEPGARGAIEVETQRFVVPFVVETLPTQGAPRRLRIVNDVHAWPAGRVAPGRHPWHVHHREVGKAMYLLEAPVGSGTPEIGIRRLLEVVEGSSAFPVAFAPKDLVYCAEPYDAGAPVDTGDARCPNGLVPGQARFADGGFFDNIPLGMALAFVDRLEREQPRPTRFIYVEPTLRRGQPRMPAQRRAPDGLAFVIETFEQFIGEARRYELKGLARYRHASLGLRPDGRPAPEPRARHFDMSSRFYGIAGSHAFDFGAFFHRALRVHDYLVGLYDGVHQLADRLEREARCGRPRRDQAVFNRLFIALTDQLVVDEPRTWAGDADHDTDVAAFLLRLLHYELRATAEVGAAYDLCGALIEHPRHPLVCVPDGLPRRAFERTAAWQVHQVFEDFDRETRAASRTGSHEDRIRLERSARQLGDLLRRLPEAPIRAPEAGAPTSALQGDRDEWTHATLDRIVRRAIDVERGDRAAAATAGADADTDVAGVDTVAALQLTRLGLASSIERGHEVFDLDPSTVARLGGDDGALFLFHLLPYYLTWDPVHGGVLVGWEPKLRFTPRWFATAGATIGSRHIEEEGRFVQRYGVGFGYDAPGRRFDDVALLAHVEAGTDLTRPRGAGLEVAAYVLGSRLRLAAGIHDLWWSRADGAVDLGDLAERWTTAYVGLGLGDLNGLLYWLICWACDGGTE